MSESAKLPPKASKLRSILRLQRFVTDPIPFYMENIRRHGDTYCFSLRTGKVGIFTTNPTVIQHVLHRNATNYPKPTLKRGALGKFVGNGILISSGEYHAKQRRVVQPAFHRKKLSSLVERVDEEIERFFIDLDQLIDSNNGIVDIEQHMKDLSFRIMCNGIYSTSLTSDVKKRFCDNFHHLQDFFASVVKMPYLLPYFNLSGKSKAHQKIADETNDIIAKIISDRKGNTDDYNDLLSMFMESKYEDGTKLNETQLREETIVLFLAGHETAGNFLSWMFYLLVQNKFAVDKILEEVNEICGDSIPTFDELLQMQYLMKVIFEGLRIYPSSWITDRVALEDDEIEGWLIPKGAMIIPFIYGVHHREDLWPDHMKFDPERFTKEKNRARHNFAHMPFGAGPRMCIGRNFAIMEIQMTVIKFLRRYHLKLVPNQNIAILPSVTLAVRYGMKLNFEKKKEAVANV